MPPSANTDLGQHWLQSDNKNCFFKNINYKHRIDYEKSFSIDACHRDVDDEL